MDSRGYLKGEEERLKELARVETSSDLSFRLGNSC